MLPNLEDFFFNLEISNSSEQYQSNNFTEDIFTYKLQLDLDKNTFLLEIQRAQINKCMEEYEICTIELKKNGKEFFDILNKNV